MHRAEVLITDPSPSEVKITIAKLKRYKLPGNSQILTELIQAGVEMLWSEIHKLINSVWNMEELSDQWKETYYCSNSQEGH
jgi:translation initiation factor 2B subunit (eIF-2B alpha/beta/delta family)